MPPRSERRRRSNAEVALRLALGFLLFFSLFHRGRFSGSDEVGLYQFTRSIWEDHSLAVPPYLHTAAGTDARHYAHFSVGQPLLALPFFGLGRLAAGLLPEPTRRAVAGETVRIHDARAGGEVEIFFVGLFAPFMSALLVAAFFLYERELGASTRAAVLASVLFGATTYVATLSTFFLRHAPESACLLGALLCFRRWRCSGAAGPLWLGSALASGAFLVRLEAGIAAPALAGYLGWCLTERSGRREGPRLLARALPAILTPLLAALALSTAVDLARWGRPWNVPQFQSAGLSGPALTTSLYALLFSPGMSLFVYSPLLLLLPWTWPPFWQRQRAEAATFLALALTYALVYSSSPLWTGLWSAPGPRYHLLSTALLLLPLGPWLGANRSRARLAAVAVLGAAGLFVQLVLMGVEWAPLTHAMGWRDYQPRWSFLFDPRVCPLAGASRHVIDGELLGPWLWRLSRGWPGQPAAPGAALAIVALCTALVAAVAWLPAPRLRRAPPPTGTRSESSAAA